MIYDHAAGALSDLDREIVAAVPAGGNWRDLPETFASKRVEQIRRSAARGEGSRSTYYGRLRWDRPAYTISTYFNRPGNGCFIHPDAPRLLTVREAARLQSFPDAYRFFGEGRARYTQVGNAVPPILAFQIASAIPLGPAVDLFAGVGGMSLGLEWAGFPLVAAVDNDEAASRSFRENRPGVDAVIEADLSDPRKHGEAMKQIAHRAGAEGVHLLAGGPPCQGFSTAGHCRLDDPRNRLVSAFVAATERLQPAYVLMENVPALLFRGRLPMLQQIRRSLHSIGYDTAVAVAHAEAYGVPQLRRRLFLLGSRVGQIAWPAPWLRPLPPHQLAHQPGAVEVQKAADPVTVREAISDLPRDAAPSANAPVSYERAPECAYQRWARGQLGLSDLIPRPAVVAEPARLFRE